MVLVGFTIARLTAIGAALHAGASYDGRGFAFDGLGRAVTDSFAK